MGFPKSKGTFLGGPYNKDYNFWGIYYGVPIMRIIEFWGSIMGSPFLGNYHIGIGGVGSDIHGFTAI